MSYINLKITQEQGKFLLDRLQADKAAFLKEATISATLGDEKLSSYQKEQARRLTSLINDLYLELNEEKESYNGR